ncbi:MAG: ATP-binding cassette domain-containing protein [Holosporales bacterium]|jgi:ABC-type multidrug transport system ATPase subunit|nr:ATP-binding cassette domain-containing protein [Holosporales bacterium]
MISIDNLTKTFDGSKIVALDGVSCKIRSNEVVGFIGPDGAGKTTLLRIVAGILTPDSGNVLINRQSLDFSGKDRDRISARPLSKPPESDLMEEETAHRSAAYLSVRQGDECRHSSTGLTHQKTDYEAFGKMSIGQLQEITSYMPQRFGLYEDLSIIENLNLYANLHNLDNTIKEEVFDRVLAVTKLSQFRKRLAGNLSGGMKQKLGLACALLKKPKILILDEPSVGVDPISRKDLIAMVNSMLDEHTTVLWSTAYLDEAEELDHVILLNDGKVIFEGSPSEAKRCVTNRVYVFADIQEKRRFSAELMKEDGIMDSIIHGNKVRFIKDQDTAVESISKNMGRKFDGVRSPYNIDPAFEDACIDMLGGIVEKRSPLEEYFNTTFYDSGEDGIVNAIHLTKKFGRFVAVDDISFSIKRGQIFGLLGPNGSGKSTTFRMLCGLLKQTAGTARIAGIDISDINSDAKVMIGYMAQKFSLYPILSVRQNLEFFSGAYRIRSQEKKGVINQMLEIFHLTNYQNMNAAVLSLGYKQRLSLACAIMHRPRVLFLDEPTSGVDPITRREFWMHINTMVHHGMSVIVTTHFMDEAENCDEIALIYKGKIRASGTPDDLKDRCRNSETATLEQAFIEIIQDVDEASP